MDNVLDKLPDTTIIGGADGPTSVFLAGKMNVGTVAAAIVIGLLLCVLGLKLIKIISALVGLAAGAGIGTGINNYAGVSGFTGIIIVFGCALALAALAFFLYRISVFFMVAAFVGAAAIAFMGTGSKTQLMIAAGVVLVCGILAAVFVEPGTIIITSVSGGFLAGMSIAALAGLADHRFAGLVIAAVLAAAGIFVQFFLYSRKTGKKTKDQFRKAKRKGSMESEVEKARQLLEDDDDADE